MAKNLSRRPDWLKAPGVADVYSLSACISTHFADYINYWKHNGYWLFNTPEMIADVVRQAHVTLEDTTLLYYEVHDREFDERAGSWRAFEPDAAVETRIVVPAARRLQGFDVVTFSAGTSPECSPLSCNGLACDIAVNAHCLLPDVDEAIRAVESGQFNNSEPGPFRVFAVYTVGTSGIPSQ